MEILLVVLIGAGVLYYLYKKMNQPDSFDSTGTAPHGVPTLPAMPEPEPAPIIAEVKSELDVNKDGKIDVADAKAVVKKTRARVKKAADLDGDGRVTVKDVKVAAARARKSAATVADQAAKAAKTTARPRTRK